MTAFLVDRRPLAVPAFRRLWGALVVAAVGGSFAQVAVPAQLFATTGSSATVGAAATVALGALIVSALWAGARADVVDRRRLLLAAQCGLAGTYAAFWVHAALGGRSVAVLLALVTVQAGCLGTILATFGAVVPRLVPVDLLVAANTLVSLVRYTGSIVGPLLAGLLIPLVGLGTLYLLDAAALLAVVWAVARLPAVPPAARGPRGAIAGFRYLAGHRLLVAVLGVDLAATVFGFPMAVFPELAHRTYGGPADGGFGLGLLYAAYPVGVFATGLLSGTFTRSRRHGLLLAGGTAGWGVTVVLLGLAPGLWWAAATLAAGGAALFVLSTFRTAITQAYTDDAMRGRIQGALTVVTVGGPQLANMLHGAAAAVIGPQWTIAVGGVLTVVAVAAIMVAVPELGAYRSGDRSG